MATRKRLTNRFKSEYAKASKKQKGEILDRLVAVGMGRSTARRLLKEPVAAVPRASSGRGRRPLYSLEAQAALERLWLLMGMPCGPYMKAMMDQWIPALDANGELAGISDAALAEVTAMSASTIDRRLRPLKQAASPKGMSLTSPARGHLRNSIRIRKATDEIARLPGLAEADTVAHCGPSARGEFARTLTMVDYATNWTVNVSTRNNAKSNIRKAVDEAIPRFPFAVTCFDSDNGTEFINDELVDWLQQRDIEQTRSRPYKKNDQATVESRNNHVVRKFAFYWRYDTPSSSTCSTSCGRRPTCCSTCSPRPGSPCGSNRDAMGAGRPYTTSPAPHGPGSSRTMPPTGPPAAPATSTRRPACASRRYSPPSTRPF